MREEMYFEGVDLSRLAPAAWVAMFVLAFVAHAVGVAGYGMSHVRMQTVVLLTIFAGFTAMTGTAQRVRRYLDTGHHGRAWTMAAVILLVAVVVLRFSLPFVSISPA